MRREAITHNTCLLVIQVPDHTHLPVPVGHHVYLRSPNKGVYVCVCVNLNVVKIYGVELVFTSTGIEFSICINICWCSTG